MAEGCLCSRAWEPTAFAVPALDYLTLPFRPANQCPTVGKLRLPLRTHPWKCLLGLLSSAVSA